MKGDSIPICRSIFNHWIYQDAEYLKVWVTMLGRAQYTPEPKTKIWKGITYTQHRGEFIFGRKQWNIDTGVSEDRLRRVIILLVKDNMIELVAFKGKFSMYKIINYEKFNQPRSKEVTGLGEDEPPTEPQQDPNTPPTEPQQTTTIKNVKKVKNSSCPQKFSDEQKSLAVLLLELIRKNNPKFKEPNINKWADEIRLMIEQDKRSTAEIDVVIRWCQRDSFWRSNILSTKKLREKFDALQMKMQGQSTTQPVRDWSKIK